MINKKTEVPTDIRVICSKWCKVRKRPAMQMIAAGEPGVNLIDLLLETITCRIAYILLPKQHEDLNRLFRWVLSQTADWIVDENRGHELDRSKGVKNG